MKSHNEVYQANKKYNFEYCFDSGMIKYKEQSITLK